VVDAWPEPRYSANTGSNSNPRYYLEYLPSNMVGKGYVYFARQGYINIPLLGGRKHTIPTLIWSVF